uniref:Transmembrane protein n=1 Tax=Attheya septentrionalis TaxID=420275 RepID=A0A7S2U801_9STRA|mmetsp:Transcript_14373/g.26123  ORF Transcript_14373/g.26123 Transcript_14373/m.26123 type:complete len:328 (+) Transcript_14373:98-1081(+)
MTASTKGSEDTTITIANGIEITMAGNSISVNGKASPMPSPFKDEENSVRSSLDIDSEPNKTDAWEESPPENKREEKEKMNTRLWRLTISSNVFFLIGSVFYFWISVLDLRWELVNEGIPPWVMEADDVYTWYYYAPQVEDDFVFNVGTTWVSKYQMLFFVAAFSFVITGALAMARVGGCLDSIMLVAGIFGLASAMTLHHDERITLILSSISVHLFCLEAITVFFRRRVSGSLKFWFWLSDGVFLLATTLGVALSYVYAFNKFNIPLARLSLFTSTLWLVSSVIFIGTAIHMRRHDESFEESQKLECPCKKQNTASHEEVEDEEFEL